MSLVIVACPSCFKNQEVGVPIPPDGLRYDCAFCQAPFMVKLPDPEPEGAAEGLFGNPPAEPTDPLTEFDLPPLSGNPLAPSSSGSEMSPATDPSPFVPPPAEAPPSLDPAAEFAPAPTRAASGKYDPRTFFGLGPPGTEPGPAASAPPAPPEGGAKSKPANTFFGLGPPQSAAQKGAAEPPAPDEFAPAPTRAVPRDMPDAQKRFSTLHGVSAPGVAAPRPPVVPPPRQAPTPPSPSPPEADLLAPRESVPRPGDLPASRSGGRGGPMNLPAARESIPRPDDLLRSRDAGPGGSANLPAARESIPRPDDLLRSRGAGPGSSANLPGARENIPRPDDLLVSHQAAGLPEDLMTPRQNPAPPAFRPPPSARPLAPPPRGPANAPPLPSEPPPGTGMDLFTSIPSSPNTPLSPLDFGGPPRAPTLPPLVVPPVSAPVQTSAAPTPDSNFSLQLEGASAESDDAAPVGTSEPRPLPMAAAAAAMGSGLSDTAVPQLAPVSARTARPKPVGGPTIDRRRLAFLAGGVVGVAALGVVGFFVYEYLSQREPEVAEVLGPLGAEVARDHFPAYGLAAERLVQAAADRPKAFRLRAAAAEYWLLSVLARGAEKSRIGKAEQVMTTLPAQDPPMEARRARALLALSKGKAAEATSMLAANLDAPENQLVIGIRNAMEAKSEAAVRSFRAYLTVRPDQTVAHYLIGRALEGANPEEASKAFKAVLAKTPDHAGATLGIARLEPALEKRLASLETMVAKLKTAPPGELAEAYVALGRAAQGLGRSADALAAFGKALAADPQSPSANISFSEAYMLEGRYDEALQRLRGLSPAAQRSPDARFSLGGALIATGRTAEGLPLVQQAARGSPTDPRGLYWTGFAAELSTPPDPEAAAQNYRAALKLNRRFLPATLKLAALLQRQGRAQESLAALREAEAAGAPPTALQLAFGDALVVAQEPARAEEVFRKILAESPQLVPAHLGLAAALEGQGKIEAAREALQKAVEANPNGPGLRERLAGLEIKLGNKDAAMDVYKAEIAAKRASPSLRVAMAKLALELGRLDEGQAELDKIIDEEPGTSEALFTRARMWEARKDMGRALQDYRRAQRYENTPQLNLSFARALFRVQKESEALTTLEFAMSLPEARMDRGRYFYRKGEYDRALADFAAAAKLSPTDAQPHLWAGKSHDRLGDAEEAVTAWRAAIALDPALPEAQFNLGRIALDRGQGRPALEHLRKAAPLVTDDAPWAAEFYYQLGAAEAVAGTRPAAVQAYKKYLTLVPADAPARAAIEKQIRWYTRR